MQIIMRFRDGKSKAMTFSYDDGVYQDKRLLKLFETYGLKATFNLNSGLFGTDPGEASKRRMTKEEALEAYGNSGHEIAIHSCTHPHLERIPVDQASKEVLKDRETLEEMFHTIVRGGAYPFGSYNDETVRILKDSGICYCRTTETTGRFDVPHDWLRMPASCHHASERLMELAGQFTDHAPEEEALIWRRKPWLFYVWGHSYEFDQNTEYNNWDRMEAFCRKVSRRSDVWYATNLEIYEYTEAFRNLQMSMNEKILINPTATTLYFEYKRKCCSIKPGEKLELK